RDSEKRRVLTRAKARDAASGTARQQRLLTDVAGFLELRQHHFVAVAIRGEDLDRAPHDHIDAVAGFAFPENQRRGRELDDLGGVRENAELVGVEVAEQRQTLEELLAFRRAHDAFGLRQGGPAGARLSPERTRSTSTT